MYNMWFAHARDPSTPGQIVRVFARSLLEQKQGTGVFFCPVCGEQTFFVRQVGKPQEKGFRPAHFKHQKRALCGEEECDLRIDSYDPETYISQKIRTPLFLRLDKDGRFILSAGFHSADKDLLKRLWDQDFRKVRVRSQYNTHGSLDLEPLLTKGEIGFIDLNEPITKQSHARLIAVTDQGEEKPASLLDAAWEDTLDWFGNPMCTGALFECGAGMAGQKIMTGSFVEADREYLLAIKDTGWNRETILDRVLPVKKPVGILSFPKFPSYTVYKVQFPSSKSIRKAEYLALTNYLQDRIGVLLCDVRPGIHPLWPPAAKKGDAYFVERHRAHKDALACTEGLAPEDLVHIYRTTESSVVCERSTAGMLDIAALPLNSQLQPVSVEGEISNASRYQLTDLHSILTPIFYAQQSGTTKIWTMGKNGALALPMCPAGYELRSNCGFTVCDIHVTAGEKYHLFPSKKEYLVMTDAGQVIVLNTTPIMDHNGKYFGKYRKE